MLASKMLRLIAIITINGGETYRQEHIMKKILLSLFAVGLLVSSPASAMSADDAAIQARISAMQQAVNSRQPQVWLQADQYNKDVEMVMKLNGIGRDEAIERISRSLMSQTNNVPKALIPQGYGQAYDPSTHTYRQAMSRSHYAGMNVTTNQPVFTAEKRATLGDNFWYCSLDKVFTYTAETSICK